MKFTLHNAQQGHQVLTEIWTKAKPYLMAGNTLSVTVEREKRSIPQNAIIHKIIGEVAKQASHVGSKWDIEDFKRLLTHQWAKETGRDAGRIIPSLDGTGFVQLGIQTRKFDKETASEFVEWLYAWCANNGVEVS